MIFSAQQIFSDDQALTATAVSENVIDTGVRGTPYDAAAAVHGDIGKGAKIPLLVQVTETFTGAITSMDIAIETGATTALGTVVVTVTVAVADLVEGYQIPIEVLPNSITERYLGIRYTLTGAATTGQVTAGITMGNQTNVTGA